MKLKNRARKDWRKIRKKGILFTIDALFASVILIAGLLMIAKYTSKSSPRESIEYISTDVLSCLSELKISDLNSSFVSAYLLGTNNTDLNNSVLEQIGTYWAVNDSSRARNLTEHVLAGLFQNNTGMSLILDDDIIFEKSFGKSSSIFSGDRMITGIAEGAPMTGSTSSAYLRKITDKRTKSFAYFGGFIGQGNISVSTTNEIPSDVTADSISGITMELDAAGPFDLYINSGYCGYFTPTVSNMSPDVWNITSCKNLVITGKNVMKLEFDTSLNRSYVAGGFVRIDYITSEMMENISIGYKRYNFPGITGVANLYDSFYIPGTLTNMSMNVHFESLSKTYLTIGGVTIFQEESNGTMVINLSNYNLTSFPINLNYDYLSNKTTPLRFASYNETFEYVFGTNADVVLVTDLSGSMKYRMNSWTLVGNAIPGCKASDIIDPSSRRLGIAACLDSQVNAIVMNSSRGNNTNRLWLVDFSDDANPFYSSNLALLTEANIEDEIDTRYKSKSQKEIKGGTCLSCAINQAYEILDAYSNDNRSKSVIVMTDGIPTYCSGGYGSIFSWSCNETSIGTSSEWPGWWQSTGCLGDADDCEGNDCDGPINNAINSARRLKDDLNATVYAVGLGPLENCNNSNYTVTKIAEAGNGSLLVSSNGTQLLTFYQNISNEIISKVQQSSQTVITEGNLSPSTLYNDSYIEFYYIPVIEQPTPNEISVLSQTEQFNSCSPIISIPSGARVVDAKVVSYSDYHWTDGLSIDGIDVFNLSTLSVEYTRLGDPYEIQLPVNLLSSGNHTLLIRTGDSPENYTGCSPNNSMIYNSLVPSVTSRSEVVERTIGCKWTIQFEDDTFSNKTIPSSYSGAKQCMYTATNHSIADGSYDAGDAYDIAVFNLLRTLDFDDNGKVFVNLDEEDIEIVITTVSSVPYLWGPTLIKTKVWQ